MLAYNDVIEGHFEPLQITLKPGALTAKRFVVSAKVQEIVHLADTEKLQVGS